MSKNPLPKAVRKPSQQPVSAAKSEPDKPRFRKLIDKDEMESIVTSALLAEKSPAEYTELFCSKEGYTGKAKARVHEQVEHLYGIRLAQQKK